MKFSAEVNEFLKTMTTASKAISSRNMGSVLDNLHIEAVKGKIIMRGNDLELSIITSMPAEVLREGTLLVPIRTIYDLIRSFPNERVFFDVDENYVMHISCAQTNVDILAQDASSYPMFYNQTTQNEIILKNETFRDLVRESIFACAPTLSMNPVITGVYMEVEENNVTFTALDGYKMASRFEKAVNTVDEKVSAIIPGKTLTELLKIVSLYEDDIRISIVKNKFILNMGETQIAGTLLEGPYINYKALMPSEINTVVKISKNDLLTGIERAGLLTDASKNSMVKLDFCDDVLNISSESNVGKISEDVPAGKTGNDIKIAFNVKFLGDILKNVKDENIIMEFRDSVGPCLIKPVDSDRFVFLLMPVRYTE